MVGPDLTQRAQTLTDRHALRVDPEGVLVVDTWTAGLPPHERAGESDGGDPASGYAFFRGHAGELAADFGRRNLNAGQGGPPLPAMEIAKADQTDVARHIETAIPQSLENAIGDRVEAGYHGRERDPLLEHQIHACLPVAERVIG